ncbi:alpha/beta hydrolase [Paractinoplanes rishiriensis]|uniref:Alpha/beta hydrolase n=2 Tax=Paractinoplanes rishiriensis TaxID=1050105 RepID=A0A919MVX3_9ACTN|nr:alpha/beta hydrolase [Actinoplanes rishiriensis]
MKRVLAVAVAGVLLLAGLYAGILRHRSERTVSIGPDGAYPVGRATHELADRSRTDELAPRGGSPRMLSVWLWYPAAARAGSESAYAPGAWRGLHRYGWAQTGFERIRTGTYDEAPVAAGKFPIVVLLPGLGLAAPQYAAVAAGLASRGYLVAGVTPTYSAALTVLGSGAVRGSAAGSDLDGPHGERLATFWAADARFAAERVGVLLGDRADRARVTYVGHAFGGAAAIEACRTDVHCAGAASLDGAPVGPAVTLGLQHPLLLLGAGSGGATADPATHSLFAASGPSSWAYTVGGAEPLDFTDYAAYWLAAPVRRWLPVTGGDALPVVRDYLVAFLGTAVRGTTWQAPEAAGVRPAAMLSR